MRQTLRRLPARSRKTHWRAVFQVRDHPVAFPKLKILEP
jgi:hypothetical protein